MIRVVRIEEIKLDPIRVRRQVAYVTSIIASDVPIRRDRANSETPAAKLEVAYLWRQS